MDSYVLSLTIIGLVALSNGWIIHATEKAGISYSIVFVLLGMAVFSLFNELPWVSPFRSTDYALPLTELMVIIALMSTGLRIDRRFSIKGWRTPLLLVTVAMVLSIAAMAAAGYWLLGFGLASAVLLGAVLAPTDPVLAADVQVGPPGSGNEREAKFALTAEAGMNDGLAFPFTWLAIALATGAVTTELATDWLLYDVVYRIAVGLAMGYGLGRLIAVIFFKLADKWDMAHMREGLVVIAATLLLYGATELVHGYGFIAVFVGALAIRNYEFEHEYHQELHRFGNQLERILLSILLLLLGGAVVDGILNSVTMPMLWVAVGFVLCVRPVATMVSLSLVSLPWREKLAISFLGIKGIGSFFYLAFALNEVGFTGADELWALTALVVLLSIAIHGLTATYIMRCVK